jgi:hypothetical protein
MGEGQENMMVDLYDESRDTFFTVSVDDLLQHAALDEADKLMFRELRNERQTILESQSCLQAQFKLGLNDGPVTCLVSMTWPAGLPANGQAPAGAARTAQNWINYADGVGAPVRGPNQPALLLVTSKPGSSDLAGYQDNNRRHEQMSFYTGSGWFNTPKTSQPLQGKHYLPFLKTMCDNEMNMSGVPVAYIGWGVNNQPTIPRRQLIFKKLMMGLPPPFNGQPAPLNPVINMGMRPNLHIGNMVLADKKPNTLRFVHVAGHIMAQTVVTRSLGTRLMQQVYQNTDPQQRPNLREDRRKIRELFGITDASMEAFGAVAQGAPVVYESSYYGLETSVLAYMAAAMLHPDSEFREHCRAALAKERNFDMEEIADNMLTWVKFFLNALPTPNQGAASPMFDAFEQVRLFFACAYYNSYNS